MTIATHRVNIETCNKNQTLLSLSHYQKSQKWYQISPLESPECKFYTTLYFFLQLSLRHRLFTLIIFLGTLFHFTGNYCLQLDFKTQVQTSLKFVSFCSVKLAE